VNQNLSTIAARCLMILSASMIFASSAIAGSKETVLHSFNTFSGGVFPMAGLIADSSGNLYGVTWQGGVGKAANGYGTVFELTPSSKGWTQKVLYRFAGGTDGIGPDVHLIFDQAGDLYGGTCCGGQSKFGTIFKLTPQNGSWTKTTIHSFNGTDGNNPSGPLIFDQAGNLYGECAQGGEHADGSIFELSPPVQPGDSWTETTLYSFGSETANHDGAWPNGGLVLDQKDNLFGTTSYGGTTAGIKKCNYAGCGVVFELSPPSKKGNPWTETVLHNFTSGTDGANPESGMIFHQGNLYGTTANGGTKGWLGLGAVFEMSPGKGGDWTETIIYRFPPNNNDGIPEEVVWGLTADPAGNLYGTTVGGYGKGCPYAQCGTVYELKPPASMGTAWTERTLFQFSGLDGIEPVGSLLLSNSGVLYGATESGGAKGKYCTQIHGLDGCGTVFQIIP